MIRKYRGQLVEAGIDYDAIPRPVVEEKKGPRSARSDRHLEIVQGAGNRAWFVLRYSYDPRLVEKVKALPGRRWDAERRQWTVPVSADGEGKIEGGVGVGGEGTDVPSEGLDSSANPRIMLPYLIKG